MRCVGRDAAAQGFNRFHGYFCLRNSSINTGATINLHYISHEFVLFSFKGKTRRSSFITC